MKKINGILVSLALIFGLTGCNGGNASGGTVTESNSAANTAAAATTTTEAAASASSAITSALTEESTASESSLETSENSSATSESGSQSSEAAVTTAAKETVAATETAAAVTTEVKTEAPAEPVSEEEKTLVVYFSWSSNTAGMAKNIADLTGADTFEIVPVNPYPEEYTPCTEVALEERDNNARPEIQNLPASVSEYDNIIIGYPIWWHTEPMIIGTFLENYDLSGIDIYPFTQSASMNSQQFEQSMEFVRGCAGKGTVHDGLFARPSDNSAITGYLEQNGLTK